MEIPDKLKFEYLLSLDNHISTKGIDKRKDKGPEYTSPDKDNTPGNR